jgi:hypothetical protein
MGYSNNKKQRFLRGPCRDVISKGKAYSLVSYSVMRKLGDWCEMAATLGVGELQFSRIEPLLLEAVG